MILEKCKPWDSYRFLAPVPCGGASSSCGRVPIPCSEYPCGSPSAFASCVALCHPLSDNDKHQLDSFVFMLSVKQLKITNYNFI